MYEVVRLSCISRSRFVYFPGRNNCLGQLWSLDLAIPYTVRRGLLKRVSHLLIFVIRESEIFMFVIIDPLFFPVREPCQKRTYVRKCHGLAYSN